MSAARASRLALLAALAMGGLSACGSASSSQSSGSSASSSQSSAGSASSSTPAASSAGSPARGGVVTITIQGYAYHPPAVTVASGTKLVFVNHDGTAHTATASSPPLDSGTIKPGGRAAVTVTAPGTYSYICQFHPFMHGTIKVT